jgi:putative flippase GtrA
VGLLGTVVNMALFEALYRGILKRVASGHTGAYVANTLAFLGAVLFNYMLNKVWTFKFNTSGLGAPKQLARFLVVCSAGLLVRIAVMALVFSLNRKWDVAGWPVIRTISLESSAVLIGIVAATLWNYSWTRTWVFGSAEKKP